MLLNRNKTRCILFWDYRDKEANIKITAKQLVLSTANPMIILDTNTNWTSGNWSDTTEPRRVCSWIRHVVNSGGLFRSVYFNYNDPVFLHEDAVVYLLTYCLGHLYPSRCLASPTNRRHLSLYLASSSSSPICRISLWKWSFNLALDLPNPSGRLQ